MKNLSFVDYKKTLEDKYNELKSNKNFFVGYPANQDFDYSILTKFFEFALNNIGDASLKSNIKLNTHEFEVDVLKFFASLYNKENNYWGYITNGGTEGNLTGIHIGLLLYPTAIIYYSTQSHYSVTKSIALTRSKAKCITVLKNGEIDYSELEYEISKNKKFPVFILANIGTTMTGAIDDLQKIKKIFLRHNITQYYIHCDAAFHGFILPFCNTPRPLKLDDFHSISISGHKLIGSPIPCGIFLTHKNITDNLKNYIEYIKSGDCTISGSRNGLTPLILWCAIHQKTLEQFKEMTSECLKKSEYICEKMLQNNIPAWTNPYSPIVVFTKPSDKLIKKWSIAPFQKLAHIIATPNLSYATIDELLNDLILDHLTTKKQKQGLLKNGFFLQGHLMKKRNC